MDWLEQWQSLSGAKLEPLVAKIFLELGLTGNAKSAIQFVKRRHLNPPAEGGLDAQSDTAVFSR
jgi:hypothetical protein